MIMRETIFDGYAIGIDLGGTRIKGVLIDLQSGELVQQLSVDTRDGNAGNWKQEIREMVSALKQLSFDEVKGIGLAAPGIASADNQMIINMPGRMQGLEGFNWQALLQHPVFVLNDAHAALVAEAHYGSATGHSHALMLTLGTGVGGGLWLNGKLFQGNANRAGHLGHMILDVHNPELDITNVPGSLEQAIGNATVPQRTFYKYKDTRELVAAYRQGEPIATRAWLDAVRQLAAGLASLINIFSPEVIVLGGGITQADDALFGPLATFMDIYEWRPKGTAVPIKKASFTDLSGSIGAAVCSVKTFQFNQTV